MSESSLLFSGVPEEKGCAYMQSPAVESDPADTDGKSKVVRRWRRAEVTISAGARSQGAGRWANARPFDAGPLMGLVLRFRCCASVLIMSPSFAFQLLPPRRHEPQVDSEAPAKSDRSHQLHGLSRYVPPPPPNPMYHAAQFTALKLILTCTFLFASFFLPCSQTVPMLCKALWPDGH